MEILFLSHNVKGRGTYVRCYNFARNLVQFGHRVVILTSTPEYILFPKREIIGGVEIVCMPDILGKRFRNGGLGPIDTLLRCLYLFLHRFDLVMSFDHRPAVLYPALVTKYLRRFPLVSEWTDLHGTGGSLSTRPWYVQFLIRPYEDFTEKRSKTMGKKLIVISNGLKEKALGLGIPPERITWIPGGADVDSISPLTSKIDIRARFGLPVDKKLVGYTGYSHYDMEMLTRALCLVQKARDDVVFVTTGAGLSPSDKDYLEHPDRIVELGFLSPTDYAAVLPAMDLFVFPFADKSINTCRWPNKIGDYMAAGRPTVSNRTGDIIALFEEHAIGLLADDDPEDFAEKILAILADEQKADILGQNARKVAEEVLDWRILSKKLEDCFFEVLEDA